MKINGRRKIMKMRTFTMTILMTLVVWIFAAPLITGCGNEAVSDSNTNSVENTRRSADVTNEESMKIIRTAVVELLGENYWPNKQLTKEELETETGITEDMYEYYLAEKQNVETDIDTMIIIKAKADYLSEIETKLNDYREVLMMKYRERPQELGKVEASRIEIIDTYICFVQLGADTKAAAKEGDEKVITLCQQENERAVDIIEKTIFESLIHSD